MGTKVSGFKPGKPNQTPVKGAKPVRKVGITLPVGRQGTKGGYKKGPSQ